MNVIESPLNSPRLNGARISMGRAGYSLYEDAMDVNEKE
jgi:hypothetical protein